MRKAIYAGEEREGLELLASAKTVSIATTGDGGQPILRSVHAVLDEGCIAFHGAPAGEKMEGLGRRAVVCAEDVVASIPSYFVDPERACPATTYYRSAQAHGVIQRVEREPEKARLLDLLMRKYQPEGGHVPITSGHPLYVKAVRGLLVAKLRIERLDTKTKLGQNRTPHERRRVLEHLWSRGEPEDVRAIHHLRRRFPEIPSPAFLRAGMQCGLDPDEIDEAIVLLAEAYWLADLSRSEIRSAVERSNALVGMRDEKGDLVGFARAVSDGKVAWIYDVVIRPNERRAGAGRALMGLLLDHPVVRSARAVRLSTRDAMAFYERLGFTEVARLPRAGWTSVEMLRRQNVPPSAAPPEPGPAHGENRRSPVFGAPEGVAVK